jgi:hypothetical protein
VLLESAGENKSFVAHTFAFPANVKFGSCIDWDEETEEQCQRAVEACAMSDITKGYATLKVSIRSKLGNEFVTSL